MALIEIGADAPEITARTGSGDVFRLTGYTRSPRVMLVFYPKDFTPGCTTQLANVQRSLGDMRSAGVEPFGLSADDAESHKQFCDAYNLEFELLVDENTEAARAYGAIKPEGGIRRSVFVIGEDGKIIFAQEGAPSWPDVLEAIGTANNGAQPDA
ncbi:MAG TPA: peroxiredoxin [Thermomicrobiales bacterium]|nr:peroxiredoxin [Thermomicrobiales bacterium]